jgi:hypothetical protein
MNAVEIEAALSDLAQEEFDATEFPYQFLAAFGNKDVALKKLRTGHSNTSDLTSGVSSTRMRPLTELCPNLFSQASKSSIASS